MKDARVASAMSHWAPRFVSNGVILADFEEVTASHTESLVGVTFDPSKVTPAVLREKIEGLGYDVAP